MKFLKILLRLLLGLSGAFWCGVSLFAVYEGFGYGLRPHWSLVLWIPAGAAQLIAAIRMRTRPKFGASLGAIACWAVASILLLRAFVGYSDRLINGALAAWMILLALAISAVLTPRAENERTES